ncbi:hypothetical protein CYLTODRAFT_408100 [Cylindrobasidium torrendii FP15055 ss-10]|uniref:MARVEL domain-containing protein n=1 Tax=Cylindrobasidium torrendii FP15055 ss-10 TaxID=1314674 RepID=A0A0D7BP99_9AGAR|nr:hypothetical protein CYLTODRAFT_408100 [Cylindrobasidium torrendii FP15055 ss-10]
MPTKFNILRTSLYGAVLVFTCICLGMAGRLVSVLASSDLTRFIPFAIFVCAATLLIIISLLGFSFFLRERNPISTRIEIGCLGLAGLLWLVLGAYLVSSESREAEVECFTNQAESTPLSDELASFHTNQYQAMYNVLTAFAFLTAVLLLGFFAFLLFLAVRRHRMGDVHMWHGPVTSCAWFNDYSQSSKNTAKAAVLPAPVTQRTRSRSRPAPTSPMREATAAPLTTAPVRGHRSQRSRGHNSRGSRSNPARQHTADHSRGHGHTRQQGSAQSSLIGSGSDEYESGWMANPNRTTSPRRN